MKEPQYPARFDLTGDVSLYDQVKAAGINPETVPLFEALVINTLQTLLFFVTVLRRAEAARISAAQQGAAE